LNRLALSSNDDRNGVFINAAAKLNLNPALIEKDFWVSWLLDIIFNQSSFSKILMFKGGTSLSKCYGVINRFSEDIDIILDWTKLGISGEEPWHERSTTKQNAFRENINKRATEYISSVIMPELIALVQDSGLKGFKFYINQSDPHTLRFKYPKTNKYDYILDEVYLEIGPFAAWTPHEVKNIKPLLAGPYPDLMDNHTISIMTVEAKRTFWEKATILHMVAHQNPNKTWRRYSRHYYDLYMMLNSTIKEQAVNDLELLNDVIKFKKKFYYSAAACYDAALPNTINLVPDIIVIKALKKDFIAMQDMIYGKKASFDQIIARLQEFESHLHNL
jgi:hypothetical protein